MQLNDTIRYFRKKRGFSQKELSEISGINPSSISLIESGVRMPLYETIVSLAKALGVTPGIIYLHSFSQEDFPEEKKPAFELIRHSIRGLIEDII